jgi:Transglutaminase-like superfamily
MFLLRPSFCMIQRLFFLVSCWMVGMLALFALVFLLDFAGLSSVWAKAEKIDQTYKDSFQIELLGEFNDLRAVAQLSSLEADDSLQLFLENWVARQPDPAMIDFDEVFAEVQEAYPGAQYLAANLATGSGREELIGKLSGWTSLGNPDFHTVNTVVFSTRHQVGALSLLSHSIPPYTLAAANAVGGRFYNTCPHCCKLHAVEIEKVPRTLILSCPSCNLPFAVLAANRHGEIRPVTSFFDCLKLPEAEASANPADDQQRVLSLWNKVEARCVYELDAAGENLQEMWKSSQETWSDGVGDCEDTAILLADVLLSAGFEARVAIGWNGNIGQHAWVVVRCGDQQYILESTLEGYIDAEQMSPLTEAAPFYQPEQLFDRDHVYVTNSTPEIFRADYFSPTIWQVIPETGGDSQHRLSQR